jgi:hypothetical protein
VRDLKIYLSKIKGVSIPWQSKANPEEAGKTTSRVLRIARGKMVEEGTLTPKRAGLLKEIWEEEVRAKAIQYKENPDGYQTTDDEATTKAKLRHRWRASVLHPTG